MPFFSNSSEEEKEKKEKQRKKEIDEIIKEHHEKKKNKSSNDKKISNNSPYAGISLSKKWTNNSNFDRFLKCMSPALGGILIGTLFFLAGFAINEIAKASSFLSALALPKSITNIIATTSFWKVIGILSITCFALFLLWTGFLMLKNAIIVSKGRNIESSDPTITSQLKMEMQKFQQKNNHFNNHEYKKIGNKNGIKTISKNNYNAKQQLDDCNNNFYKAEKKQYLGVDINKNDKNKQKNSNKTKKIY